MVVSFGGVVVVVSLGGVVAVVSAGGITTGVSLLPFEQDKNRFAVRDSKPIKMNNLTFMPDIFILLLRMLCCIHYLFISQLYCANRCRMPFVTLSPVGQYLPLVQFLADLTNRCEPFTFQFGNPWLHPASEIIG